MRERSKSCCWEVTCRLGRGGQARGRSPFRGPVPAKRLRLPLYRGLETPSHLSPREKLCAKAPTVNKLRPWANVAQARPGIACGSLPGHSPQAGQTGGAQGSPVMSCNCHQQWECTLSSQPPPEGAVCCLQPTGPRASASPALPPTSQRDTRETTCPPSLARAQSAVKPQNQESKLKQ